MHLRFRMLAAVLAPLALTGCGAPIGVQVASLFADGLSFLATEKTLSDHGLSAVTGEDCAVWRGLKGDAICRDDGSDPPDLMVADAAGAAVPEDGDWAVLDLADEGPAAPAAATETAALAAPGSAPGTAADAAAGAQSPAPAVSWAPVDSPADPPADPPVSADAGPAPVREAAVTRETLAPPPSPAPPSTTPSPAAGAAPALAAPVPDAPPVRWQAEAAGGTFLVIASYRHAANAERFARRRAIPNTIVLSGTAKGRRVYRVAVGPVAAAERRGLRARLAASGFADVWALRLENPNVVHELAAAR